MMVLSAVAMFLGATLVLLAGVGQLRLPDVFTRMQAATKAGTVGVMLLLLSVALRFSKFDVSVWMVLVMGFLAMTAPVAAHMIARVAYLSGVPLWKGTVRDELAQRLREDAERPGKGPPLLP